MLVETMANREVQSSPFRFRSRVISLLSLPLLNNQSIFTTTKIQAARFAIDIAPSRLILFCIVSIARPMIFVNYIVEEGKKCTSLTSLHVIYWQSVWDIESYVCLNLRKIPLFLSLFVILG